jgi:uncharacterized membrane protein YebE (DUF533 family)
MFDAKALLEQFLGGGTNPDGSKKPLSSDMVKGLAGGALAGGLAGVLLGGRSVKGAMKLGGTVALAGLAYKVYSEWQASKSAPSATETPAAMKDVTPKPEGTVFLPSSPQERDALSLAILRAMIAAAKSDGHVDAAEQQAILAKLEDLGLGTAEKAFVMDELKKPLDIDAVVAAATTPELAVEIYAASVLTIAPDDPAELAYLSMLASRLKLDPGLKARLETEARKAVA